MVGTPFLYNQKGKTSVPLTPYFFTILNGFLLVLNDRLCSHLRIRSRKEDMG